MAQPEQDLVVSGTNPMHTSVAAKSSGKSTRRASVSAFAPVDIHGDALGASPVSVPVTRAHPVTGTRRHVGSPRRARQRAAAAGAQAPARKEAAASGGHAEAHAAQRSGGAPSPASHGSSVHTRQGPEHTASSGRGVGPGRGRRGGQRKTRKPKHTLGDIELMDAVSRGTGKHFSVNRGGGAPAHVHVGTSGVGHLLVEHEPSPQFQRKLRNACICAVVCCILLLLLGAGAGIGAYWWWLKSEEDPDGPTVIN